jgi:hypothetical protein
MKDSIGEVAECRWSSSVIQEPSKVIDHVDDSWRPRPDPVPCKGAAARPPSCVKRDKAFRHQRFNTAMERLLLFHDPRPDHFFSSSLSLGAGRSVVFFSLSHQSFQNFSSSSLFFSLACLSSRRESIVANHSSRAASCSSRVAYWFMQLFIAFCCVRHAKVAVNVLLVQHAAKSMMELSV